MKLGIRRVLTSNTDPAAAKLAAITRYAKSNARGDMGSFLEQARE
jgi:hypothetical protein